ncbi:uncharacterized protein LOC122748590 [Dromiciops gliroides]|uniref:uncharacterized protein LOC122748590 n=1 Tax=Dromiciops gliroides TaxID=33562 RepID=UPI001CC52BC5|nr:uncharacterized protein LOC122748590 [Dromiciops gliroides]
MATGPITSRQLVEKELEAVSDFIFLGKKITAVTATLKLKDACSFEGELRCLECAFSKRQNTIRTPVFAEHASNWCLRQRFKCCLSPKKLYSTYWDPDAFGCSSGPSLGSRVAAGIAEPGPSPAGLCRSRSWSRSAGDSGCSVDGGRRRLARSALNLGSRKGRRGKVEAWKTHDQTSKPPRHGPVTIPKGHRSPCSPHADPQSGD